MKRAISDKQVKYIKARTKGLSKEKSKEVSGYAPSTKATVIENTQALKSPSVKSAILNHISLDEIASIHTKIMKSDNEAVAINAIKLGYERIEPENHSDDDVESIVVTMKG